jgi:nucleoside-diphosphate-sugar epimerase
VTILITGVTGFVGSNLVSYFKDNAEVKLYGHTRNVAVANEKFKNFSIDVITDYTSERLDDLDVDCIIHLAGIAHDLSNQFVEADYYKVNFENTVRLYDEFLKSKAKTFIYFSSIKAAVSMMNFSNRKQKHLFISARLRLRLIALASRLMKKCNLIQ